MKNHLTIASRASSMALWQANHVKQTLLHYYPNLEINILKITTAGDKDTSQPIVNLGGKNVFTKELQHALLQKTADLAVHCVKDMSVQPSPGLILTAVLPRQSPHDALINNHQWTVATLPPQAIVGTGSPRRQVLLKALRPDLQIREIRGNVNTRLDKLDSGQYDAIVLAAAGLGRLNQSGRIQEILHKDSFIPAIGQGAIGVECRANDSELIELLKPLNHLPSQQCIACEQAVNQRLQGDCHSPIGAHAAISGETLHLQAMVGCLTTNTIITAQHQGSVHQAQEIGNQVAQSLIKLGALSLLRGR